MSSVTRHSRSGVVQSEKEKVTAIKSESELTRGKVKLEAIKVKVRVN